MAGPSDCVVDLFGFAEIDDGDFLLAFRRNDPSNIACGEPRLVFFSCLEVGNFILSDLDQDRILGQSFSHGGRFDPRIGHRISTGGLSELPRKRLFLLVELLELFAVFGFFAGLGNRHAQGGHAAANGQQVLYKLRQRRVGHLRGEDGPLREHLVGDGFAV